MICSGVKPTMPPMTVCADRQYWQLLTWLTTRLMTSRALPVMLLLAF